MINSAAALALLASLATYGQSAAGNLRPDVGEIMRMRISAPQAEWRTAAAAARAIQRSRFNEVQSRSHRYGLPYRPYGNHCAGDLHCQAILMVDAIFERNPVPTVTQLSNAIQSHRVISAMSNVLVEPERNTRAEFFASELQRHVVRGQQLRRMAAHMRRGRDVIGGEDLAAAALLSGDTIEADFAAIEVIRQMSDEQLLTIFRDRQSLTYRLAFLAVLHGEEMPETQLRVLDLLIAQGERSRTAEFAELIDLLAIDLFGVQWLGTRVECTAGDISLIAIARPEELALRRARFGLSASPILPSRGDPVC